MAEQNWNPNTRRFETPGVSSNTTQRGALAGQDARFAELSEQQLWDQFKKEKGLSAFANKAQHAGEFNAWKAAKKPAPGPTPSPVAPPVVVGDESALPNALAGLFG